MKIIMLILLTVSLAACAVVPVGPPPFYDGFGPGIGGPRGHFGPMPPPPPPPPFRHHGPGGHGPGGHP